MHGLRDIIGKQKTGPESGSEYAAPVVKLADTLDLGSNAARRAGSSPVRCIMRFFRMNMILQSSKRKDAET